MRESQYILREGKDGSLRNIFLYQLGGEIHKIAVMRGLHFANMNLWKQLGSYCDKDIIDYFFDEYKEPTVFFFELMDFWEAAKEHIKGFSRQEKAKYPILGTVYEMDGHYYRFQYQKMADEMGTSFGQRIDRLCDSIEEIHKNKVLKILDFNMKVRYEISLRRFEKGVGEFEYTFGRYHLADTMINGGIAVVIAGSGGLTAKQLHGFALKNGFWKVYPAEVLEPYRTMLLRSNRESRKRGKLRGCKW